MENSVDSEDSAFLEVPLDEVVGILTVDSIALSVEFIAEHIQRASNNSSSVVSSLKKFNIL